jgi:ferredoxin-NADP reductase
VPVLQTRDVVRATPRTRIIRIDLGSHPFTFQAGQAVIVGLHDSPLRKPYSIACSPRQSAESRAIELLVQIDDSDAENPHLERLTPGTSVEVSGPLGAFGLPSSDGEGDILFVAGGTGIAPLRSMMWDVIEQQPGRRLALIYSVRSADEIAYESELRLLAHEGRLDLRLTITRLGREQWLGPRGRIDMALVQSVVRTPETDCVLCGPPAMISDVTALLIGAGVPAERIVRESFAT